MAFRQEQNHGGGSALAGDIAVGVARPLSSWNGSSTAVVLSCVKAKTIGFQARPTPQ